MVSGEKLSTDQALTLPRSAIVQKGEDIDFIRSGRLYDQSWHLYRQKWYAAAIFAFFAFNLLLLLKKVLWDRHIAASPLLRNRQVLARTLKQLARVRHGEDIAPLLEAYIQEKSGLGLAEITNQKISEIFRHKQVAAAGTDKFLFIKSQSELAKFSEHKKSALELKKDLETLRGLLREIDRKLK